MKKLFILFASVVSLVACNNNLRSQDTDTPVKGEMLVVADESLQPIVDAEIQGYEIEYPEAKIHVKYVPEQKAINLLLRDSARVAIITRELTEGELGVFKEKEIPYTPAVLALDGVALITNHHTTDTLMTLGMLKDMFNGKARKETKLVFDNSSSSNLNYMIEKLGIKDIKQANIFAANGTKDAIEYTKNHENAIGIIGANWISDADDSKVKNIRNDIRIMSVSNKDNPTMKDYYKPTTQNLVNQSYPLERKIYLHTKEARWGLGKGFIRYCCFQVGQLIVEKMGLLPYRKYPREIKIEKHPIFNEQTK